MRLPMIFLLASAVALQAAQAQPDDTLRVPQRESPSLTAFLPDSLYIARPAVPPPDSLGVAPGPFALADSTLADSPSGVALWKVGAASAGFGVVTGGMIQWLHAGWWGDRSPTFRFAEDNTYALFADKIGHAYGGLVFTRAGALAFETAGLERSDATLYGAGLAWGVLLAHEFHDGYGPHWGFDRYDLLGNTVGVGYEVAQRHIPALEPINFKVSYWPSDAEERTLLEDYRGQTYWLTATPHGLAPDAAKPYLPPWLGIGVGASVRGEHPEYGHPTERVWTLGLDLDVCGLGLRGGLADALCETFRAIHLPMPGLRIAPEVRALPLAY